MQPRLAATIASVLAHARAGAHAKAWELFRDAGLETETGDAAVLSLHGRLLKDRARRGHGSNMRADLAAAGAAYAAAAALEPASYPLINAATLSLLGGEAARAHRLAAEVLALVADDPTSGGRETPYFGEATRAEALLLLGRVEEARASLATAITLAPRAWEDHATTLRQFALILADRGGSTAWLDPLRPPTALHFAGSIRVREEEAAAAAATAAWLGETRVGFAYGALAAGGDIIAAEAVVAAGGELHVVLPATEARFVAQSVRPFGAHWEPRFARLLEAAASVRLLGDDGDPTEPAALELADEMAMGNAVLHAARLETRAAQLILLADPLAGGAASINVERVAARWRSSGRPQHLIKLAGDSLLNRGAVSFIPYSLAALLTVSLDGDLPSALAALQVPFADHPPIATLGWADRTLSLAFADAAAAAHAAGAIAAALGSEGIWRIAGHLGVVRMFADPVTGRPTPFGPAVALVADILRAVPAGTAFVSETFAASLAICGPHNSEPVGELRLGTDNQTLGVCSLRL